MWSRVRARPTGSSLVCATIGVEAPGRPGDLPGMRLGLGSAALLLVSASAPEEIFAARSCTICTCCVCACACIICICSWTCIGCEPSVPSTGARTGLGGCAVARAEAAGAAPVLLVGFLAPTLLLASRPAPSSAPVAVAGTGELTTPVVSALTPCPHSMAGACTPYRLDFHTITIWSTPPEAKKLPSAEKRAQLAGPVCPCRVKSRRPSRRSQSFRVESLEAESM
mmetsp:Transcript_19243/g.42882  ORF Transcript_19243/g.42882 Transcript_19243/m.42882 type:complete len:225 (+) Transcript_19243:562-1236(+)